MEVLINGQQIKIIVNIAMDYLMVDVTNIPKVELNKYVTLIRKDGLEIIMRFDFSEETFEVITQIEKRVSRKYI